MLGRWAPLLGGVAVAALAALILVTTHVGPRSPLSANAAVRSAARAPQLVHARWDRVTASPLDDRLERVSFWTGERIVAQVAVNRRGQLVQVDAYAGSRVPYGDWIAYSPALLIGLSVVFLGMTLVAPWRRLRNLDAVAMLSLVGSVVLFQHRYLDPSLIAAAPALTYLLVRCVAVAFGRERVKAPSMPLLLALTPRLSASARLRWLRVGLLVVAVVFVMVTVSSPVAVDVAYAVMAGATQLIHGVLPYGHAPAGIIHGDTYPILSYALYSPLALLEPVRSTWSSVDLALTAAVVAALVAAWAVFRLAATEDEEAGLRAALALLSFPPLLITVSTGTTDVVLAAMLAVALLLWRRPAAGAAALAIAGWFKLVPLALLPLMLAPLRGRRFARALAALTVVSLAAAAPLLALGGVPGVAHMVGAVSYQFSRGSLQSVWSALGIEALQRCAQAAALGLIAAMVLELWRQPRLAADRRRIAAMCAAILIALQLAADYWAFLYLVWVAPLVCVSLLHPGVSTRVRLARIERAAPREDEALAA